VLTYAETMLIYARLRGLKRRLLALPGMSPMVMAIFVDKLTPVPASIANPLIDGMRSDSVVRDNSVRQVFPHIQPLDYQTAVSSALSQLSPAGLEPVWEDGSNPVKIIKHEGFFIEHRQIKVDVPPETVYHTFNGLGGKGGWLYLNLLWRLRGWFDRLVGGPGMRVRREESVLNVGDVVDFYRVEALDPGRMVRLRAELRAPGRWLDGMARKTASRRRGIAIPNSFLCPQGCVGFSLLVSPQSCSSPGICRPY
jgi:hypothetical protein